MKQQVHNWSYPFCFTVVAVHEPSCSSFPGLFRKPPRRCQVLQQRARLQQVGKRPSPMVPASRRSRLKRVLPTSISETSCLKRTENQSRILKKYPLSVIYTRTRMSCSTTAAKLRNCYMTWSKQILHFLWTDYIALKENFTSLIISDGKTAVQILINASLKNEQKLPVDLPPFDFFKL